MRYVFISARFNRLDVPTPALFSKRQLCIDLIIITQLWVRYRTLSIASITIVSIIKKRSIYLPFIIAQVLCACNIHGN